jgi:hypothetical protein
MSTQSPEVVNGILPSGAAVSMKITVSTLRVEDNLSIGSFFSECVLFDSSHQRLGSVRLIVQGLASISNLANAVLKVAILLWGVQLGSGNRLEKLLDHELPLLDHIKNNLPTGPVEVGTIQQNTILLTKVLDLRNKQRGIVVQLGFDTGSGVTQSLQVDTLRYNNVKAVIKTAVLVAHDVWSGEDIRRQN